MMEAPACEMEARMAQTSGPKMMYGTTQLLLRKYFSRPYINKMADVHKSSLAFGFMVITNKTMAKNT
jgi:hypothetical protein